MVLNVVRTYSYDKPGMYNPADVEEYRRKLEGPDWHCSVHIRESKNGDSTDVCSKRRPPDMIETAIITMEPKELTFIHTIRKANGEGGSVDWGGLEGLPFGLPPSIALAIAQPEMAARMLAETAELRAHMPQLEQEMQLWKAKLPDVHLLDEQMKQFKADPRGLDKQMTQFKDFKLERPKDLHGPDGQTLQLFREPVPPAK